MPILSERSFKIAIFKSKDLRQNSYTWLNMTVFEVYTPYAKTGISQISISFSLLNVAIVSTYWVI